MLRSPEARGCRGRCRRRPGERAGCSRSTDCRPDASSADLPGCPTPPVSRRSVDCGRAADAPGRRAVPDPVVSCQRGFWMSEPVRRPGRETPLTPSQLALGVSMLQFSVAVPLSVSLAASRDMQSRVKPGCLVRPRPGRTAVAAGRERACRGHRRRPRCGTQRIGVAYQHERLASPPVRHSHSATRAWCAEAYCTANCWPADPDERIGPGCPFGGPFMFACASDTPTGQASPIRPVLRRHNLLSFLLSRTVPTRQAKSPTAFRCWPRQRPRLA